MPLQKKTELSITWEQAAAFRLARHHLTDRASTRALVSVVGEMGGAQAQLLSAAQLSIGVRHRDVEERQIEKAMVDRNLVKASCMRQTLFLVPSQELAAFSRGSASRAQREVAWAVRKGVSETTVLNAIDATLSVLDQPLTRTEIAERVSRKLGVQKRDVRGGGWGSRREIAAVPVGTLHYPVVSLVHLLTPRGIVCYGPPRGNEPTFVRADAWIPNWKTISKEEAEDALLRRYLKSFGPASARDFAAWSGMTLAEAQTIWLRQQDDMAQVELEGSLVSIFKNDLKALTGAGFDGPHVRLLPYFDSYVLGHKERDHLVGKKHHRQVYRPQGWIAPVVLVNGRIVAIWEHAQKKNRIEIKVKKFEPLSRAIQDQIQEEVQHSGRFLEASSVQLKIG